MVLRRFRLTSLFLVASAVCAPVLSPLGEFAPAHATSKSENGKTFSFGEERFNGLSQFIDGVMAQQMESREVAGAVVSVVHNGRLLFSRGYGYANIDKGEPADPERSLFRPGSTSKLFTWTALMQLVEQGRVDLDADVERYIDFKIPRTRSRPILVRHLLDHTPGFEDRGGIRVNSPSEFVPLGSWLAANIPNRVREPGVEVSYSNYATALAGYIVQRVSGEPFPDYVERHIFQPLGMVNTTFREPVPSVLSPNVALGYEIKNGRFQATSFEYYHNIMPAGAASSTANDMARFMMAHLRDGRLGEAQILKPSTAKQMRRDLTANVSKLPGFAHGFYVIRKSGPRIVGHGGNTADFHSMLMLVPEADFGIFVSMTGGEGSYVGRTDLINAVIGRLFPVSATPRFTGEGVKVPMGSYRTNRRDYSKAANPEHDIKVTASGERAIMTEANGVTTYWEQVGPAEFEQATRTKSGGPFDRIVFYGGPDDPRMSFSSQPMVLYRLVKP